jgi:hypothetical protein
MLAETFSFGEGLLTNSSDSTTTAKPNRGNFMKALIALVVLWSGLAQAHNASPAAVRAEEAPTIASAQPAELVAQDGKSLMDQVVDWYNAGQDVTAADLKGYYSGRCFSFEEPNKAKNSFFGIIGANNGPGFPSEPKILGLMMYDRGEPADRYDNANNVDTFKNDFLELYDIEGNGRPDFTNAFRKNGDYIVYTTTNLIAQTLHINILSKPKYANVGQVVYSCYYFKKLAD